MNEFDLKAASWDENPMHRDRAAAIAEKIQEIIPLNRNMTALELGAGTGLTSFILSSRLKEIVMMDSSAEMVRMMNEKLRKSNTDNLSAILFDLGKEDYRERTFDLVFNQMVLHHITDIETIFRRFRDILNVGGYLAIADLYSEDGSFHGKDVRLHHGFDPYKLSAMLEKLGFDNFSNEKCFTIVKNISETEKKSFDVFLLTCRRGK
ncbi:MAG TPA: class I SAM-dependent methyltransferase [Bacteroidales bacterium]|nr:class I SAM-dependent methyltransferase [Bacteroidales bacterium]